MTDPHDGLIEKTTSTAVNWELPANLKEPKLAKFFKQDPSLEQLNRQYLAWRPMFIQAVSKLTRPDQPAFHREGRYSVYAVWYPKYGDAKNILVLVANDGLQTFNLVLYKHPSTNLLSFFHFKEGQTPGMNLDEYTRELLTKQLGKQ